MIWDKNYAYFESSFSSLLPEAHECIFCLHAAVHMAAQNYGNLSFQSFVFMKNIYQKNMYIWVIMSL